MVSLSIDLQLACRLHAHAGESLRQVQSQRELHSATLDEDDTSAVRMANPRRVEPRSMILIGVYIIYIGTSTVWLFYNLRCLFSKVS